MSEADNSIRIDDEITAELRAVAFNAAPFSSAENQARILDPDFGLPRTHERAFQIVRTIRRAVEVEQERKARCRLCLPGARLVRRSKRNQNDARMRRLKFGGVLTQLCHMLAAG